ncbi:WXG100 family type VII secretion target [Arthrobacter sp. TMN-49]
MSDGFQGLDPADCRGLVTVLKRSAQQLELVASEVNRTVARTGWQGQDSERFRAQWPANRQRLNLAATALDDTASELLREIAEQERASTVDGGGNSLWDDIVDAGKDLWDDVTEGIGNDVDGIGDAIKVGQGWIAEQIDFSAIVAAADTGAGHLEHFLGVGEQWLSGSPPSLAGLVASGSLALGSSFSTGLSALSGGHLNLSLFEDGTPYAGQPQEVTNSSRNPLQLPNSISSIFGGVEDAYDMGHVSGLEDGDIRIVTVRQADGTVAHIVNIPGTENWGVNGSGQARDLTSNLMLVAGQSTTAQRDIVLAMERAGIKPGEPVMLAGHSQGGILAVQLGSDMDFTSRYNVTNILTVGSPVDTSDVDSSIKVLAAQHEGDIVPKLDLGGLNANLQMSQTPANVTVVTMDDPPRDTLGNILHYAPSPVGNAIQGIRDVGANHATDDYKSDLANTAKYPDIRSYEGDPSMDAFLSNDPTMVSAVDIPVGRR